MRWKGVAQIPRKLPDTRRDTRGLDQERILGADARALRGERSSNIACLASGRNKICTVGHERLEPRRDWPLGEFVPRSIGAASTTAELRLMLAMF